MEIDLIFVKGYFEYSDPTRARQGRPRSYTTSHGDYYQFHCRRRRAEM
jgi:hypothetical protein